MGPIPGHTHPDPKGVPIPNTDQPVPGHRHPIPGGQPIPTGSDPVPKHRHKVPSVFGFTPVGEWDPYGHGLVKPVYDRYGRKVSGFGQSVTLEEKPGPLTVSMGDLQQTQEFQNLKSKLRSTEAEVARARQEAAAAIAQLETTAGKEGEMIREKEQIMRDAEAKITAREAAFEKERQSFKDRLQTAERKAAMELGLAQTKAKIDADREKDALRTLLTTEQTDLIQKKDEEADQLRKQLRTSRGQDTAATTARLAELENEIRSVREQAMQQLSDAQKQSVKNLAAERTASAGKLASLEIKLRTEFKDTGRKC